MNKSANETSKKKMAKIVIPRKKKIAFVCSGGATKAGAFHLGVALALEEKGFKFVGGLKKDSPQTGADTENLTFQNSSGKEISVYVGSSAGSVICTYLASGYTLSQVIDTFVGRKGSSFDDKTGPELKRLNLSTMFSLRKDIGVLGMWNALSDTEEDKKSSQSMLGKFVGKIAKNSYDNLFRFKWLKLSGFFTTEGIERYLREDVLPTNDFRALEADLFVVATQLNHSRKVVFGKYNYSPPNEDNTVLYSNTTTISESCAASTSLPFIYSPYAITNERGNKIYYFDGEIRDTLSTHVGYDAGADLIIASYTHQPYHFTREIGSLHEMGIPWILIQALYLLIERKIQHSYHTNEKHRIALETTSKFFKEHNIGDHLRKACVEQLERTLGYRSGVDYIYIHPKASDNQMYFGDFFNLSVDKMSQYVKSGFLCAVETLRRYEFE